VTLKFVGYSFDNVPLYLVILGSLLVGFLVAGVISSINSMFSAFKIMGKDNAISSSHKEVESLKEKNHQLELEIARLKGPKTAPVIKST
jgi:cell division protein FtsB